MGISGYQRDLAYVHDAGFTELARTAAPPVIELLRAAGIANGLVIELGCGSGVTARALTDAGYDVLGIDYSRAMVEMARRRAPQARFRVQSVHQASLPRCDAVVAIGEVFNYTFDDAGSSALRTTFARIERALRPGGLLVFDSAGPGRIPPGQHVQTFRAGEDWAIFHEAHETRRPAIVTRRMVTFRRVDGGTYRRHEEVHRQRLYPAAQLAAMLRRLGFRVQIRSGYAGVAFAPGHRVLVARKPR